MDDVGTFGPEFPNAVGTGPRPDSVFGQETTDEKK
jgi:hypothetical protein